jgi:hypothetical protein
MSSVGGIICWVYCSCQFLLVDIPLLLIHIHVLICEILSSPRTVQDIRVLLFSPYLCNFCLVFWTPIHYVLDTAQETVQLWPLVHRLYSEYSDSRGGSPLTPYFLFLDCRHDLLHEGNSLAGNLSCLLVPCQSCHEFCLDSKIKLITSVLWQILKTALKPKQKVQ